MKKLLLIVLIGVFSFTVFAACSSNSSTQAEHQGMNMQHEEHVHK